MISWLYRLLYTSDSAVSTLSVIKTQSRTTSIANSPYIPGECIISTEDRCVRLWNVDINNTMEVFPKSFSNSCLLFKYSMNLFNPATFGRDL